jgi:peptidoglycan/LPS O-acetylase OafA/YrhL
MCAHLAGPHLPGLLKYTFTGMPAVIAFFVVSGFCIHFPYRNKDVPKTAFWTARAIRILIPALIAMTLAQLEGIASYNFVDGYILWSIVCELFYYAAYPALLWIARRIGWFRLFAASAVLAYAIVIWFGSDIYGNIHIYHWYGNWIVMLPSWLLGCILAEELNERRSRNVWAWRFMTAAVASFLYWTTINKWLGFYLTMNAFAVIVVFWVRAEITNAETRAIVILESVGKWSYSLYLMHMVMASFVGFALHSDNPLVVIPFALLGSYAFFLCVEKPSHKLSQRAFRAFGRRELPRLSIHP